MRNRAALIGAHLTIEPAEPTGTVVTCRLVSDRSLVLELSEPLSFNQGAALRIKLKHQSQWKEANLGRFRLSVGRTATAKP